MLEQDQLVQIKNVYLSINKVDILEDITLSIYKNQITTIVGPNGAGKSSLAKVILGLYKPSSGMVTTLEDITFSYVPQSFHVDSTLPLSTKDFLSLYKVATPELFNDVCNFLKIPSLLNKPLYGLSGGELQRVLIAQSLLQKPDLLVLDEPSKGMDVTAQAELYQLMQEAKSKYRCGILMVSHDLHFVMQGTDQVICLNKHICCHGAPEHVQSSPEYKATFGNIMPGAAVYVHKHDHAHHLDGEVSKDHE